MASLSRASAASGLVTPIFNSNRTTAHTKKLFFSKNKRSSRLVVQAATEEAAPPSATATPPQGEATPAAIQPPFGPKRGAQVKILRSLTGAMALDQL